MKELHCQFMLLFAVSSLIIYHGHAESVNAVNKYTVQNLDYEIDSGDTIFQISPTITVNFITDPTKNNQVYLAARIVQVSACQVSDFKNSDFSSSATLRITLSCKLQANKPITQDITLTLFSYANVDAINQAQNYSDIRISIRSSAWIWILVIGIIVVLVVIGLVMYKRRKDKIKKSESSNPYLTESLRTGN